MFHLCIFLFSALLFFLFTPNILITLPLKKSKYVIALVHALLFSTVLHFTNKLVWNVTELFEPTIKQGKLTLNASVKWIEKNGKYTNVLSYIKQSYPNIIEFSINDINTDDAKLILVDSDYPNGNTYDLPFNNNLTIVDINNFLSSSGYVADASIPLPNL